LGYQLTSSTHLAHFRIISQWNQSCDARRFFFTLCWLRFSYIDRPLLALVFTVNFQCPPTSTFTHFAHFAHFHSSQLHHHFHFHLFCSLCSRTFIHLKISSPSSLALSLTLLTLLTFIFITHLKSIITCTFTHFAHFAHFYSSFISSPSSLAHLHSLC
jgi:hypothetical protein